MSKRAMHNRRVQPSRADLRAEITARELEQEDSIEPKCAHVRTPEEQLLWDIFSNEHER